MRQQIEVDVCGLRHVIAALGSAIRISGQTVEVSTDKKLTLLGVLEKSAPQIWWRLEIGGDALPT